jgi:hypothetical protein
MGAGAFWAVRHVTPKPVRRPGRGGGAQATFSDEPEELFEPEPVASELLASEPLASELFDSDEDDSDFLPAPFDEDFAADRLSVR